MRKAPRSPLYEAQGERKSENPLILSEAEYKDSFDTDCWERNRGGCLLT
jgi:hypothetical protein